MSTSLLIETNEPEVTDETRFYLWFEVTMYGPKPTSWRHRINVEVSEATYRKAYCEMFDYPADMTHPLDDHWWRDRQVSGGYPLEWTVRSTRGGYIDWWGS